MQLLQCSKGTYICSHPWLINRIGGIFLNLFSITFHAKIYRNPYHTYPTTNGYQASQFWANGYMTPYMHMGHQLPSMSQASFVPQHSSDSIHAYGTPAPIHESSIIHSQTLIVLSSTSSADVYTLPNLSFNTTVMAYTHNHQTTTLYGPLWGGRSLCHTAVYMPTLRPNIH